MRASLAETHLRSTSTAHTLIGRLLRQIRSTGIVCAVLLLPTIVHAQSSITGLPENVLTGLPSWKAVLFAPDPSWRTGWDDVHDQWCQADNATWTTPWGGAQNQIAFSCFAVPHPRTGVWNASFRLRGYSGHNSNTWFSGYDIGVEGQRLNGVETVDRFFLYRYADDQTILSVSQPYDQTLVLGEYNKPMHFWVSGTVDVPQGYIRAESLILYPQTAPQCDANNAGRINYVAGASGVKDAVQVCAKDSANVYAWRAIY